MRKDRKDFKLVMVREALKRTFPIYAVAFAAVGNRHPGALAQDRARWEPVLDSVKYFEGQRTAVVPATPAGMDSRDADRNEQLTDTEGWSVQWLVAQPRPLNIDSTSTRHAWWTESVLLFEDTLDLPVSGSLGAFYVSSVPSEGLSAKVLLGGREVAMSQTAKPSLAETWYGVYGADFPVGPWVSPDTSDAREWFRSPLITGLFPGASPRLTLASALGEQAGLAFLDGLNRLGSVDPIVATRVCETLTTVCHDGETPFAAWVGQGQALARLDAILGKPRKGPWSGARLVDEVQVWLDEQPQWTAWIESDAGQTIELAIANFMRNPRVFEVGPSTEVQDGEIPLRLEVPERSVLRTRVNRELLGSETYQIEISDGLAYRRLPIGPAELIVRPPGATVTTCFANWRVEGWRTGVTDRIAPTSDASVTLQRRGDQWEMFFECPQSPAIDDDHMKQRPSLEKLSSLQQVVGLDAMTVFVGPFDSPLAVLTLTADGQTRFWKGTSPDDLRVDVREDMSSWRTVLVIPDSWIQAGHLDAGFVRTEFESGIVGCTPRPCLPWRMDPGRVRFGLAEWRSLSDY